MGRVMETYIYTDGWGEAREGGEAPDGDSAAPLDRWGKRARLGRVEDASPRPAYHYPMIR